MIKGKIKRELSIESILNLITEYDIFKRYMPHNQWELNRVCISPFPRNNGYEKSPSFIIGNKKGFLSYIDFGNTAFRGDCFTFVKQLFNLSSLYDVLQKIDFDFGLGIRGVKKDYKTIVSEYKQPEITKRNTLIQIVTGKFNKEELSYWNTYHQNITDLRDNNIYHVKTLYLNKKKFSLKPTELCFGYLYDGHWKLYRPFGSKKEKWFPNNVPITAMDGKDKIKDCEIAFINKSKKDHMVISKIFPCSCAVQNEGIACFSPENIEYLKSNSKKQILSFDSDVTGVENSQQITKLFNFGYCNVPKKYNPAKDWAEIARIHGMNEVENILKIKGVI